MMLPGVVQQWGKILRAQGQDIPDGNAASDKVAAGLIEGPVAQRKLKLIHIMDQRAGAWIHAPENILYAILSESMLNRETSLLSAGSSWTSTPDSDWKLFDEQLAQGQTIFKADTIEELAAAIGVDAAALSGTIEAYNGYAASGVDEAFGRSAESMIAFTEGPFYAVKTIPYAGRSAGGPVANDKMEVLDEDGQVISGLYLSGEIVGFSTISGEASVSGMYLGEAATFGIDAGLNAARHALGLE